MINKASETVLKVRPVTTGLEHKYYYEGPCRFGTGESLEPGYDRHANAQKAQDFLDKLRACAPCGVEILEPVHLGRTDDWDNPEEQWARAAAAMPESDILVAYPNLGTDDLVLELVERFSKPTLFSPDTITGISDTACLRCKPMKEHLVYANLTWQQVGFRLGVFRAWKVIRSTNILLACRSAAETHVSREYLINTLIAYVTVKKNLRLKDCNGFTVPCPDVCSTRRINEMKFTFCMTHALLMEQGIPSSCEFDVACVLSQQALIAVSHMSPYMGNAYPLVYENGRLNVRHANDAEVAKLMADPTNLYAVQHSVAHRRMKDPGQNGPFALRHFAFDQKFGAILRYDWNQDAGQAITMCRFSPDGRKLFVGKGTIVAGGGYEEDNCSGPVFIRVRDQEDFFNKQCEVGMHLPLVYGDFTKELIALAQLFGVEAVVAQ